MFAGAPLHDVQSTLQDAVATAIAPSSGAEGLIPKSLNRIAVTGRLSILELFALLRGCPRMIDNIKLMDSMRVEIKFVEKDGETYNTKLLAEFIGSWLFSAIGSDSAASRKRRLHDPPGTHGYSALVPMTGRKPYERMVYDVDTGGYICHAAAARYTAAGSYAGGGAFPLPSRSPGEMKQWVYSLISEKHVAIPKVAAGELPRAPQDTPYALQLKVARLCRPTLSCFLYGPGRQWCEGDRRVRLSDTIPVDLGSAGASSGSEEAEEEPPPTDPTVGSQAVVGERLRAKDSHGKWYTARVEAVCNDNGERWLLIHFMGWNSMFDEWVGVGTGRLKVL